MTRAAARAGALAILLCAPLAAQEPPASKARLSQRTRVDPRLVQVPAAVVPLAQAPAALDSVVSAAWTAFERGSRRSWTAFVDPGSGRLAYAEGSGLPWMTAREQASAGADGLALLERQARGMLAQLGDALGVNPADLVLNRERSGRVADHLWIVDFDLVLDGLAVENAHVVFRVNHGNLIQFGSEGLPDPDTARPRFRLSREEALARLAAYAGGWSVGHVLIDPGSQHLLPSGRGLAAVWQFLFRIEGETATWRARVDAESGEVRELTDANLYAQASGGVYPTSYALGGEVSLPLPFLDLSTGGFTNGAGVYPYSGGTLSSTLSGRYVQISDTCGSSSLAADAKGNLAFGTSAGTDCATPGFGGGGNTHAARTQYYQVNLVQQAARGWFPSSSWLTSRLPVNVNLELTCNAYWNGTSINLFRSGDGCGNTGETADSGWHEFGHGLDAHDGMAPAGELGSGETYGDIMAVLLSHDSCISEGFFLNAPCNGYGDACLKCTGVRDLDWAQHASGKPHTVANFIQTLCPVSDFYVGPCGAHAIATQQPGRQREAHCESYVSSEALWDLASRDLPNPGSASAWATFERLWYRSRPMARQAFLCDTSTPVWTSNGCGTDTYWRALRAVDDDDGNLANGTPHSCQLFAAFNRHGIACPSDPAANVCFSACTPPPAPVLTLAADNNVVQVSWNSTGPDVVYDLYRGASGCETGLIKIAEDLTATSYTDREVANYHNYSYRVIAHRAGNEACSASPSSCAAAQPIPCITPPPPATVTASVPGEHALQVQWSSAAPAGTRFNVYRTLGSCGAPPSAEPVATGLAASPYLDSGLSGTLTYSYRVTATDPTGVCESAPSPCTQATATGSCTAAPQFAGLASATNSALSTCTVGLAWPAATALCGGPVTYEVYRDSNLIASGLTATSYSDGEDLADRQTVTYIVRARDTANNVADTNQVSRGAAPTGPVTIANLVETFESAGGFDQPGWQHANTVRNAAQALDWTWIPGSNGASAWFADEDGYGPSGKVLVSPRFGIGPQTTLSFWHRYALQESLAPYCEDGGTLELSTDGGATWAAIPQSAFRSGTFNARVDESDFNPIGGKPAWCRKAMGAMSEVRVDLSAYAGAENARLRWYEGDDRQDTAPEPNGWFVDSVTIANTRTVNACTAFRNRLLLDGFETGDPSRWQPWPPP